MKRISLLGIFVTVAAVGFLVFRTRQVAEPTYQGKAYREWLPAFIDDIDNPELKLSAAERNRHAQCVLAIRQMGPKAIPFVLKMLESARMHTYLPFIRHDSFEGAAIIAFQILGPEAAPAVPQLLDCLKEPALAEAARMSLSFIGSPSLSGVASLLTNSNPRVQADALLTLGNLGLVAQQTVPTVEQLAFGTNPVTAGMAMRVLSEIAVNPENYIPFFSNRLADVQFAPDAAFALARSGPLGIPPLLIALTNNSHGLRTVAVRSLSADLIRDPAQRGTNKPNIHFQGAHYAFECGRRNVAPFRTNLSAIAWRLAAMPRQRDAAVRVMLTDALGRCGVDAAPGLGQSLLDEDPQVRVHAQAATERIGIEVRDGAIVRGPQGARQIALVFTGHKLAEGGLTILDELARHQAKASFFFTGDFLRNTNFDRIVQRVVEEGHYLGSHSDRHLLYCSWDQQKRTLLRQRQFDEDLSRNENEIRIRTWPPQPGPPMKPGYFVPPYEHCNPQIATWACDRFIRTVNYTRGTRATADYSGEADTNFVSSQAILDSILTCEQCDPQGLNGFLLLFHVGAGPQRQDKFHLRFGELLDSLSRKGYEFVRVDELIEQKRSTGAPRQYRAKLNTESPPDPEAIARFRRRYRLPDAETSTDGPFVTNSSGALPQSKLPDETD